MSYTTGGNNAAVAPIASSTSFATSGEKHEGTAGGFFADGPHTVADTFVNVGSGDKVLIVKTAASYDGVVDVLVGTTAGASDLANIDDIIPGNIGSRATLVGLVDGDTYHVTVLADADAETEVIEWCVVDPFYVVPDNPDYANEYKHVNLTGHYDITTQNLGVVGSVTLSNSTGVPVNIVYGSAANPLMLTLEEGENVELSQNAVSGWIRDYEIEPTCFMYNGGHSGPSSNANPYSAPAFQVPKTDTYNVYFAGTNIVVDGWLRLGTAAGASDVFEGAATANRITPTDSQKVYQVELPANTDIFPTLSNGGGGSADDLEMSIFCEAHPLRQQFDGWTALHSTVDPIFYGFRNSVPYAQIVDNQGVHQAYRSGDTAPVPLPNESMVVRFRYYKDTTNTDAGMFRLAGLPGHAGDFRFSYVSKDLVGFNTVGNGILPELVESKEDYETIEHTVRFFSDAQSVDWIIYPGAAASVTSGTHTSNTGVLQLAGPVEFNVLPEFEKSPILVNGLSGLFKVDEYKPAAPVNTSSNATGTDVVTGFDLVKYSEGKIEFTIADQGINRPWQNVSIDVATLLASNAAGNTPNGYLLGFDNDFVRINNVDAATGTFNLQDNGRDFQIVKAVLYVDADMVSTRVGMYEEGPSGRTPAEGYLAMNGVVTNGAIDYPVAASRNPLYVSGDDFDFTRFDGAHTRNLGGPAEAEGVLQQDEVKAHTHAYTRYDTIPTNSSTGGNNGRWRGTTAVQTASTGGAENRVLAVAVQKYMIVDTYTG